MRDRLEADDVFAVIRDRVAGSSRNQKIIAQLVFWDPHWVLKATIGEIAARAGVSAPTVARFARQLGFPVLRDFKLSLAIALARSRSDDQQHGLGRGESLPVKNIVQPEPILREVGGRLTALIGAWMKNANASIYDQAAQAICRARQIACIGGDAPSSFLAQDMRNRLSDKALNAITLTNATCHEAASTTLQADDILIVVSTGEVSSALLSSIEVAKLRGVNILAITERYTRLSMKSDLVLEIDGFLRQGAAKSPNTDVLIEQIVIIETMVTLVLRRRDAGECVPGEEK